MKFHIPTTIRTTIFIGLEGDLGYALHTNGKENILKHARINFSRLRKTKSISTIFN